MAAGRVSMSAACTFIWNTGINIAVRQIPIFIFQNLFIISFAPQRCCTRNNPMLYVAEYFVGTDREKRGIILGMSHSEGLD